MYVLNVVISTYKSSLALSGLYNNTVFVLMYTHVSLINFINQSIITQDMTNNKRTGLQPLSPCFRIRIITALQQLRGCISVSKSYINTAYKFLAI